MRRRHSQRPHWEGDHAQSGALQRLVLRIAPAVEAARVRFARLPDSLVNGLFATGAAVEWVARGVFRAVAWAASLLTGAWNAAGARRRLMRNAAVAFGVAIVLIGAAGTLIVYALTQEQPGWWRAMPPRAMTESTGNRVQNELSRVLTSPRPLDDSGHSTPWGLAVNPEQANAWLNTKLRDWIDTRSQRMGWIDQIREVQVDFDRDRIAIGARFDHQGSERIFSATLVPQVREDGSLWMLARNVQIGRLSVPAAWVLPDSREPVALPGDARVVPAARTEEVDLTQIPEAQMMFAAFAGRQPIIESPALRLPDGRNVRLLSLTTSDEGLLIVTCRTERR